MYIEFIRGDRYLNNVIIAIISIIILVMLLLNLVCISLGIIYVLIALITDITSVYMMFYGVKNLNLFTKRQKLLNTSNYIIEEVTQKEYVN